MDARKIRDSSGFLSVARLAELFGKSEKTIYRWSLKGTIPRLRKFGAESGLWANDLKKAVGI